MILPINKTSGKQKINSKCYRSACFFFKKSHKNLYKIWIKFTKLTPGSRPIWCMVNIYKYHTLIHKKLAQINNLGREKTTTNDVTGQVRTKGVELTFKQGVVKLLMCWRAGIIHRFCRTYSTMLLVFTKRFKILNFSSVMRWVA